MVMHFPVHFVVRVTKAATVKCYVFEMDVLRQF